LLTQTIDVPLWALIALLAIAIWGAVERALVPGVRWYLRRRVNRAIAEVNSRLKTTIRPFHLTKRQVLIDRLVYDPEVIKAMESHAEQEGIPREAVHLQVQEYAKEIVPAFNAYIYFRFGYWVSKKISRLLYRVRVRLFDEKLLEEVDPESTIVFVMNHRSNMDYMLVSYLVMDQSTMSYAVGEWARVWPLNTLIKAMGAFFVRRGSGNPLYRKVLQRYVHMATQAGVCQAVFLEGGLSHDGRLRDPKMGFLNYMLRDYNPAMDRDIVFVPIAINYDRILEDRSLLHRRDPEAKKKSKWFVFWTTWRFYRKQMALSKRARHKRFGYAGVNFGRPLSAHKFCEEAGIRFRKVSDEERREAIQQLADRLMNEIEFVMPILPLPLVATVFQHAGDETLTDFEVKARTMELVEALQDVGAPIRDREKPREDTLDRAISILRHRKIVLESNGHYRANPDQAELLSFYAASLEHWDEKRIDQIEADAG
jgi:glycerol-3-phosphate O-acyltransferase